MTTSKSTTDSKPLPIEESDQLIAAHLGNVADPEFYGRDGVYLMSYIQKARPDDQTARLRVARLDPLTGDVLAGEENSPPLCEEVTPFLRSGAQGGEFGWDADRRVIVFSKIQEGRSQIACVRQDPGSASGWSEPFLLTDSAPLGRIGATPSREEGSRDILVNYTRWGAGHGGQGPIKKLTHRDFYWVSIDDPLNEHPVEGETVWHTQPPQWVGPAPDDPDRSLHLLYSSPVESAGGARLEQIVRYRTGDGRCFVITDDTLGHKYDPDTIVTDKTGQLYFVAGLAPDTAQHRDRPNRVVVYKERDGAAPYETLEHVRTLDIPEEARARGYKAIRSMENFCVNDRPFVVVRLVKGAIDEGNPLHRDSTIWVWSIDGLVQKQVSREIPIREEECDENIPFLRGKDCECIVGAEEVFVYYSVYTVEPWDSDGDGDIDETDENYVRAAVHRCRTGVRTDGTVVG